MSNLRRGMGGGLKSGMGSKLDFPKWRRAGAERITDLIHSFHMHKLYDMHDFAEWSGSRAKWEQSGAGAELKCE